MSATILQFVPRTSAPVAPIGYSCDISSSEKRGFSYVDACVPMGLTVEFMNLVTLYCENEEVAFDMLQPEPQGLVLIDACVPEKVAAKFRAIVAAA